ncbi:TonB-dependent receptor [Novosphingobium sp. ST904]|uniref:TonB-dependent receptor n=1 Tax=Novosphingobium sp. ST904 TaxID=1684385 RepID=UPI0009EA99D4|nr:TonB-dependent receptor [Novosphingobium sp. ST904]TCM35407.1 iron complex outermembrane receptor protein [Novosphingobium sp. ST904]
MSCRSLSALLLASSFLAISAPVAQAQETASRVSDEPGGEIFVTARRREESAQTVPVSVTAFNEEMLREKAIVSTQDLTYTTPGLNVAPQTSRDTPSIVIRGQRRATAGAAAPSVVTYFADVPLPNEGSIVPTFDVGSIQVLKGPQGTLFGRNTTGGALLLYPTAPDYDFGGYGQVTLGSYNERTFEGAVNVPIMDEHVALRLAGQVARRDGYTKNHGIGGNLDDRNNNAFRASLLVEPVEGLKNVTVFDWYRARENGTGLVLNGVYPNPAVSGGGTARTAANAPYFDCGVDGCDIDIALSEQQAAGVRDVSTSIDPYSNRTFWGLANTTTLDVGTVTFKNIFGYRSSKVDGARDMDGTYLALYDGVSNTNVQQYSNEFQAMGKLFGDKLDWIVGAFYLKSDPNGVNGSVTYSAVIPGKTFTYNENYNTSTSKALFGQIGYAFGGFAEGLRFNGGFRYTWDKSSGCSVAALDTAARIGPDACEDRGGKTGSESSKAPTWTLGFDYKVNDDLFLYVTNRRGYRSAGYNQSGLSSYFDGFETFKPEKVTDYEAGIKSSWQLGDVKGRFNIAAYTSKYNNIQRSIFPGADFDGDGNSANDPSSLIINAAKATIQGTEFDFSVTPVHGFTLSGFGAYTDAKYDEYDAPAAFIPLLGNNPVNNKFSYTPKWTVGGGARYAHDLGEFAELVFNANWFHSTKVWYVERPLDTNGIQKAYDTVNLKLDLNDIEGRGIDIGFFIRNLFDVTYAAAGGVVTPSITSTTLVYNEPRVFGAQLRVSFGKR